MRRLTTALALAASLPVVATAQPARLSLADALARAETKHPALIDPRADRLTAATMILASRAAYAPKVSVEWSLARTDDPVAVFGSKLRQGIFAASDFTLDALNAPRPITNTAVGLSVEQPIFAPEGWHGRRAAIAATDAAQLGEARASQFVAFDVIQGYFVARLARERIAVLTESLEAARQTLAQVLTLRREGVITVVDEQLARSRVSEMEAAVALAASQATAATDQLLLAIGESPGSALELTDGFESAPATPADPAAARPDLLALQRGLDAADAGLAQAKSQYLPSVGAFGIVGTNQGRFGALSGPTIWTAGVMVRWTPFRGFADQAVVRRARIAKDAVASRLELARRRADAEVAAAVADSLAARAALAAAEQALGSAGQASRVATTRYGAGLSTIAELLAVRAAESSQRLMQLDARYRARLAEARLALARGVTPR